MRPWSDWFPDLAPHVPGCPMPLMEHELRRAAQSFFTRTRAWRVDFGPVAVPALTSSVNVTPFDANQRLVDVEALWFDGVLIAPVTPETLDGTAPGDWRQHSGVVRHYWETMPGNVGLYPRPVAAATTGVTARLAVEPSDIASGLPADIATRFFDAISLGARARLMLYPGKPWTNVNLAEAYGKAFGEMGDVTHTRSAQGGVRARSRPRVQWT